jgi:hypothetical protein
MNNRYTYLVCYTITVINNHTVTIHLDKTVTLEHKLESYAIEELRKKLEDGHRKELKNDVAVSFQNFILL